MTTPITKGANHIGLTVSKIEESAAFFVSILGWKELRRNNEYPAIFVGDGSVVLTLWAVKGLPATPFDRKSNVGLHHLALLVESEASLNEVHERLKKSGTPIEFAPQQVGLGPAKHMMCFEPSGIRVEFIWPGN
ncbi:VOC family protein [Pusillimonas sp. ANT_WB101]|uniref:VOC family protein n=1 Tax=Pusillimonas sp. ANT_WB101 TaxID=2597356 RepID=UPI0011EDBB6B|nr:VOC family protein [Pusillimonas sp. ANT_WB101]KAA0892776.1 VOC family protein [Pusillimonas sp. ANT_WB101]